ncbi:MAG: S-adenosylmethionine:tRNA ribosyltransferase-isomerase [Lewinellaceae bacterium]|nr:S-adenosylmethionine:tRNA ribosyltransferase-isomerase [Lewinellaceae bacterium]
MEQKGIPTATPEEINIANYDYDLPASRIAQFPAATRDSSRLLVYRQGALSHQTFRELPAQLPPNAVLLFNNTRVIHARLRFQRATGATIEIFCLDPLMPVEHQGSLGSREPVIWKCLIGNNKRWKDDSLSLEISLPGRESVTLYAERLHAVEDAFAVRFSWDQPDLAFGEVLHAAGLIPLPPYLNREQVAEDADRYQTVYAQEQGSVAAPTAGLHFTDRVFADLAESGVQRLEVTLHVGAGTFKPVKADRLADHHMHEEQIFITQGTIAALAAAVSAGRPIIPVGTTSLRLLESLYWHGISHSAAGQLAVKQWDPYQQRELPTAKLALENILNGLDAVGLDMLTGQTQLLIAPGYSFRLASGLITNFHQPRSTLLLLIAAMVGEDWRRIYAYALDNDFRFLSFGDSSLLLP